MKRVLVLGLTMVALSVIALAQSTKNNAGSKVKSEGQAQPPIASINPASIDFKDQVTKKASKPQRITITNTGGKELYINSVVVDGDNKEDFAFGKDTCTGATIGINKSCIIDIVFTPGVTERRKAVLTITDDVTDS